MGQLHVQIKNSGIGKFPFRDGWRAEGGTDIPLPRVEKQLGPPELLVKQPGKRLLILCALTGPLHQPMSPFSPLHEARYSEICRAVGRWL